MPYSIFVAASDIRHVSMNSTRNLAADDLQITLTNIISLISTIVNLIGFYTIFVQKSSESAGFKYTQRLYQLVLYLSQFYAATVLNIVFLFPIPGVYCIGWLRNLSGKSALWCFILFDVLFALQGQLLAVVMVIKVESIARPTSPFKMSLLSQSIFIFLFIFCGQFSFFLVLLASYSPPSEVLDYIARAHPSMLFLSRYPFLWMISSDRHFAAFYSMIVLDVGVVFTIFSLSYIFLMFELDLQVNILMKSMLLSCHVSLYLFMFYFGTVLNLVVLFPMPAMYCIGWLRETSGYYAYTAMTVFFVLFVSVAESMIFTLILKLGHVVRPDSLFKLQPIAQSSLIILIALITTVPQCVIITTGYASPSEIHEFLLRSYPSMAFVSRYPCLWSMTSNVYWFAFAFTFSVTITLSALFITTFSVLVLYEIERRAMSMSMSESSRRMHRRLVSNVVLHAKTMIPFLLSIPVSVYLQFFVEDDDDVSVPVVIAFCVFISTPIATMLMFLWSNKKYRKEVFAILHLRYPGQFSLFLAQFYWGSILNPIPLLPLPGVYSIGLLKPLLSTFVLLLIWFLLFSLSIFMMYMILLIRLRVLARRHHIFHFRDSSYVLMLLFLFLLIHIPVLTRILPYNASEESMREHVRLYYPNCLDLASSTGFFVFVNTCKSTKGVSVVLVSLFGGATFYLSVCAVIIHEIRTQSTVLNANKTRNHIKVLKHTIAQNVFRLIFLAIAPAIVLRNAFQPPETDTISVTIFANSVFTAAPIPCAIVILIQNDTYREFLLSKLQFLRRNQPSNSETLESRSGTSIAAQSRKTTLF
ncbi:unnamed protein product [Caenorhabditis sp. 36 PRJEB53466]|nr:unnamed protein product [Caenorhabditis sp. 36 PRJEB53466]